MFCCIVDDGRQVDEIVVHSLHSGEYFMRQQSITIVDITAYINHSVNLFFAVMTTLMKGLLFSLFKIGFFVFVSISKEK